MSEKQLPEINYVARRKKFLKALEGHAALLPSARQLARNSDVTFPFRQESNFFYLTGFDEPHSLALFSASKAPFKLFVPPKNRTREIWEGPIVGPAAAKKKFGADESYSSEDAKAFQEAFIEAIKVSEGLYYRIGLDPEMDRTVFSLLETARKKLGRTGRSMWPIKDPGEILGEMRLIKDAAEQKRMEIAASISAEGHSLAMSVTKPGMYEYELEALLFDSFRAQGAARLGYDSIVATGKNACVLHYVKNNQKIKKSDLVLIDAGAEFEHYSADITRTFPANDKFTTEQKEIYEAVLKAQVACVKMAKPGVAIKTIQETAIGILTEELIRLKVLKGTKKDNIKNKKFFEFYPHGIGHYLGMDVHDVGTYYKNTYENPRPLEAGMVLTIEPGLYFQPSGPGPSKYKGIGVRIEDDVLITKGGNKVLTSGVPKSVEEVEALCRG